MESEIQVVESRIKTFVYGIRSVVWLALESGIQIMASGKHTCTVSCTILNSNLNSKCFVDYINMKNGCRVHVM